MPLAEAQAQWIVEILTGRYAFPSQEDVSSRMAAMHERSRRRFYASPRHTMEVDFDQYLFDLTVRLAPLVVRISRVQQKVIARRLRKGARSR